jgi:hypothetical protein
MEFANVTIAVRRVQHAHALTCTLPPSAERLPLQLSDLTSNTVGSSTAVNGVANWRDQGYQPSRNGTEGTAKGGAIYCVGKQTLALIDVTASENIAAGSGGAVFSIFCDPILLSSDVRVRAQCRACRVASRREATPARRPGQPRRRRRGTGPNRKQPGRDHQLDAQREPRACVWCDADAQSCAARSPNPPCVLRRRRVRQTCLCQLHQKFRLLQQLCAGAGWRRVHRRRASAGCHLHHGQHAKQCSTHRRRRYPCKPLPWFECSPWVRARSCVPVYWTNIPQWTFNYNSITFTGSLRAAPLEIARASKLVTRTPQVTPQRMAPTTPPRSRASCGR